ncbi:hypothetical protein [Frankia sp. Cr1]|uniref:hypothetical protein n=1 Tax=Frankia sp. Cr1 TaxID=3073931 RepID=UPI002AD28A00|nr:hypothetical protein [Frankia sp. Cr1]
MRGRRRDDHGSAPSSIEDTGSHRAQPRNAVAGTPLLRRLLYAVVILAVAFAVGGGAGFVWQKINPGKAATAARPATAPSGTAAAAGPSASASPAAGPGTTTAPATVPADWVAVTDAKQRAKFSHPPGWNQRRDNTAVFFIEAPAGTASGSGTRRRAGLG